VATATWITGLSDGKVGMWTSSASGKAKRLRNDPRVTVQPGDSRGHPKSETVAMNGSAQLLMSGADFDAVQRQIKAKYGVMVPISRFFNTLGHLGRGPFPYGDVAVVITPEGGQDSAF
jgi:PPOX class probable F420-dependent enzyme